MLKNQKRVANMVYTVTGEYGTSVIGGENSFTDTENVTIHSDEVLASLGLTPDEIIRVQLASSAHEGGHNRSSSKQAMMDYMTDMRKIGADLDLANGVMQILEDYRIDSGIAKERPGYWDMNRDSLEIIAPKFGLDVTKSCQTPQQALVKAVACNVYGYRLQKHKAWKTAVEWGAVDSMSADIIERAKDATSTQEISVAAKELYVRYFGMPSPSKKKSKSSPQDIDDTDKEEEQGEDGMPTNLPRDTQDNESDDTTEDGDEEQDDDGESQDNDEDKGDSDAKESDEDGNSEEEIEKKISEALGESTLERLLSPEDRKKLQDLTDKASSMKESAESKEKDRDEVRQEAEGYWGKSLLKDDEIKRLEDVVCTDMNKGAVTLYVDSKEACKMKNHIRNTMNARIAGAMGHADGLARQLAQEIRSSLTALDTETSYSTTTGKLTPNRLWKATECDNAHVFTQSEPTEEGGYIVDIVVDASGSNSFLESEVATSTYVVAKAFDLVGIPTRVTSFRTYGDASVMQRYRDYHDPTSETKNIFSYVADGANRDGLAYRTVYELSDKSPDLNHIFICISDGAPSGASWIAGKCGGSKEYENWHDPSGVIDPRIKHRTWHGKDGLDDTAQSIRDIRKKGVALMGVFISDWGGNSLVCEKLCFGQDFAWVKRVSTLVPVVSKYLKKQISKTFG